MERTGADTDLLSTIDGTALVITLHRPRAMNALTLEMCQEIHTTLRALAAEKNSEIRSVVLTGAGARGFCGGGDIKLMAASPEAARAFGTQEYRTDDAIATSRVPVVSLMTGITMGGGIGLGGHAAVRIVTETSTLAMPETRIGISPDVGGSYRFAQAPGFLGEYFAITGARWDAADAIALGFADTMVPEAALPKVQSFLADGGDPRDIADRFGSVPASERLTELSAWWDPLVAALPDGDGTLDTAVARADALSAALTASAHPEAAQALAVVRRMCPASVVVALETVDRARRCGWTLRDALNMDSLIMPTLAARSDFPEGVRALLIDKDQRPNWQPAQITDVAREPALQTLFTEIEAAQLTIAKPLQKVTDFLLLSAS